MMEFLAKHFGRYQHDPAWRDIKTFRILFRVFTDDGFGRNLAPLVYNRFADPRMPHYFDFR
jgi:hypothetical protein